MVWNKSEGKQGKEDDPEGRWMAGEAAGNAETSMELYEGVHSVWGGKITLPYGTATKGAKKQQHLQGLSAINCHTCDYNT